MHHGEDRQSIHRVHPIPMHSRRGKQLQATNYNPSHIYIIVTYQDLALREPYIKDSPVSVTARLFRGASLAEVPTPHYNSDVCYSSGMPMTSNIADTMVNMNRQDQSTVHGEFHEVPPHIAHQYSSYSQVVLLLSSYESAHVLAFVAAFSSVTARYVWYKY